MQHQQKDGEPPTHCLNDLSDPSTIACNPMEPMIKYEDYENDPIVADGAFWDEVRMPTDPYNDYIPNPGDEWINHRGEMSVREEEMNIDNWSIIPIEPFDEYEYDDSEINA